MILPFIFIHKKVYKELRDANSSIIQQYFYCTSKKSKRKRQFPI